MPVSEAVTPAPAELELECALSTQMLALELELVLLSVNVCAWRALPKRPLAFELAAMVADAAAGGGVVDWTAENGANSAACSEGCLLPPNIC